MNHIRGCSLLRKKPIFCDLLVCRQHQSLTCLRSEVFPERKHREDGGRSWVEKRSAADQAWLAELRRHAPELDEAAALAEEFTALLRERAPGRLDAWLQRAQSSTVQQLRGFAQRLGADYYYYY
jgi:transposase